MASFGLPIASPLLDRPRAPGEPFVLHRGYIESGHGEQVRRYDGEVALRFAPSPRVAVDLGGVASTSDVARLLGESTSDDDAPARAVDPDLGLSGEGELVDRSQWTYTSSGRRHSNDPFGSGPIARLVVHLVNLQSGLDRWIDGGEVDAAGERWRLRIQRVRNAEDVRAYLRSSSSFEITHVAEITAINGADFGGSEADSVLESLYWFLAFVNGARVGTALPMGVTSAGKVVWSRWSVPACSSWSGFPSWSGHGNLEGPESLWPTFCLAWERDGWRPVLKRAIGAYLSAAQPDPIDLAPISAALVLELLGWFVLYDQEGWLLRKDHTPDASVRLRLLLKWAGISADIPPDLEALASAGREFNLDGPAAVVTVRNRLVHPTTESNQGPRQLKATTDIMVDAWQLSTWYVELVLLRLLGYHGHYQSRLTFTGWVGDMRRVPWHEPRG